MTRGKRALQGLDDDIRDQRIEARRYWPNESPIGETVSFKATARHHRARSLAWYETRILRLDACRVRRLSRPLLYQPISGDSRVPKVLVRTRHAADVSNHCTARSACAHPDDTVVGDSQQRTGCGNHAPVGIVLPASPKLDVDLVYSLWKP